IAARRSGRGTARTACSAICWAREDSRTHTVATNGRRGPRDIADSPTTARTRTGANATARAATSSDPATAGHRAFRRCVESPSGTATLSAGAAASVRRANSLLARYLTISRGPTMTPAMTRLGITAAYVAIAL